LVGSELDTETGKYLTYDYGWKAGIDSFLEVSRDSPSDA
jgi:mannosyl-oligosaccharide alpha-1,2-mannosidase